MIYVFLFFFNTEIVSISQINSTVSDVLKRIFLSYHTHTWANKMRFIYSATHPIPKQIPHPQSLLSTTNVFPSLAYLNYSSSVASRDEYIGSVFVSDASQSVTVCLSFSRATVDKDVLLLRSDHEMWICTTFPGIVWDLKRRRLVGKGLFYSTSFIYWGGQDSPFHSFTSSSFPLSSGYLILPSPSSDNAQVEWWSTTSFQSGNEWVSEWRPL